jgi:HD domain
VDPLPHAAQAAADARGGGGGGACAVVVDVDAELAGQVLQSDGGAGPRRDGRELEQKRAAMTIALAATPVRASGSVDTSPISLTPSAGTDLDPIWTAVVPETRSRGNDIHLPISLAYAERLCAVYPAADTLLVRVAILLHDTGWGRVDEDRILTEGFSGADWRRAAIRYEHEKQGCAIAREVLPPLGYGTRFVEDVVAIIDGHDTRREAKSLEDALVRDADRLWRFDQAGIALASGWFKMTPAAYCDRLAAEIVPELLTEAAIMIAEAELARSNALLKMAVLR